VRVVRHTDAADFLEATMAFRAGEPALTNILGSVATSVVAGHRYDDQFWYSVVDESAGVVGCAIRTPPHLLAVAPMKPAATLALVEVLREVDPNLPGVVGPRPTAELVAARLGRPTRESMVELVRVLGDYRPPTSATPGSSRAARDDEFDLLVSWMTDFHAEAGLLSPSKTELRETISARTRERALLLWSVGDEPVSIGGHAALVATPGATVGRVGPVYTPTEHRARGYGTAITATVVESLRPRCDLIMLFTDASNATSNGIYARLGFEVAAEVVELQFES
jgi:predicted GNAT family acetyltransferase